MKPIVIHTPLRRWQCVCGMFYPHTHGTDCPVCAARLSRILAGEVRPARVPLKRAPEQHYCKSCGLPIKFTSRNTLHQCGNCANNVWAAKSYHAKQAQRERQKRARAANG